MSETDERMIELLVAQARAIERVSDAISQQTDAQQAHNNALVCVLAAELPKLRQAVEAVGKMLPHSGRG